MLCDLSTSPPRLASRRRTLYDEALTSRPSGTTSGSGLARLRASLNRADRTSIAGMYGFVILLHLVGFGVLLAWVVPHGYHLGTGGLYGVGVGVLAYTFGLRHAFDADHIAAIDNTTRKLMADNTANPDGGRKPLSVGFWFSLGHSTIVFGLAVLLSAGVKALGRAGGNDSSELHSVTGVIGSSVSGIFLWILGILNLVVLIGIIKVFAKMRAGDYDERELEEQLNKRGFMNRFLGGLTKSVRKAWHIYPIGVLFGLGFDTATEVGLLVLAGGAAAFNLPFYAILILPILFAAGMSVMDTTDGVFMNVAYWAVRRSERSSTTSPSPHCPSRSRWSSVITIELVSVLTDQANITTGPLAASREHPVGLRRLRDRGAVHPRLADRHRGVEVRPHRTEVVGQAGSQPGLCALTAAVADSPSTSRARRCTESRMGPGN